MEEQTSVDGHLNFITNVIHHITQPCLLFVLLFVSMEQEVRYDLGVTLRFSVGSSLVLVHLRLKRGQVPRNVLRTFFTKVLTQAPHRSHRCGSTDSNTARSVLIGVSCTGIRKPFLCISRCPSYPLSNRFLKKTTTRSRSH
jgi:hypothetical protein